MHRALIFVLLLGTGCGSTHTDDSSSPACAALVHDVPTDAHHTATCAEACGNALNPPTGGPHCSATVTCRVHAEEQPPCAWIHNLEHGHAVLLYNCPDGCAAELDQLTRIWNEHGAAGEKRILLTPWAGLQKRFAAVVWGSSWSGDTVDEAAIGCVLDRQDAEAPEPGLGCAQ